MPAVISYCNRSGPNVFYFFSDFPNDAGLYGRFSSFCKPRHKLSTAKQKSANSYINELLTAQLFWQSSLVLNELRCQFVNRSLAAGDWQFVRLTMDWKTISDIVQRSWRFYANDRCCFCLLKHATVYFTWMINPFTRKNETPSEWQ